MCFTTYTHSKFVHRPEDSLPHNCVVAQTREKEEKEYSLSFLSCPCAPQYAVDAQPEITTAKNTTTTTSALSSSPRKERKEEEDV